MKVLLFLQLPLVRLAQGRPGWEAAGWSPQPLADLTKSRGRLEQSPGRVLESSVLPLQSPGQVVKSLGRLRLWRLWSHLPKSSYRLPELWSRIRLLREEPTQRWSLILVKA